MALRTQQPEIAIGARTDERTSAPRHKGRPNYLQSSSFPGRPSAGGRLAGVVASGQVCFCTFFFFNSWSLLFQIVFILKCLTCFLYYSGLLVIVAQTKAPCIVGFVC